MIGYAGSCDNIPLFSVLLTENFNFQVPRSDFFPLTYNPLSLHWRSHVSCLMRQMSLLFRLFCQFLISSNKHGLRGIRTEGTVDINLWERGEMK